jgi:hypothetical protein
MRLPYDPYQVFRFSKTPAGLYARQKWLEEAETPQWKSDFQETTSKLMAHQLPDGSWRQATVITIRHLFGLHLTVRESSPGIKAALNWLLGNITLQDKIIIVNCKGDLTADDLNGLPFVFSRQDMLIVAAVLFLATIFGDESNRGVSISYQFLSNLGIQNRGQWFDGPTTHNMFRAMVVHPIFSKGQATTLAVGRLAKLQTQSGDWGDRLSFYQTLNALAHLDTAPAENQLEKAFEWLFESQKKDGTWSEYEPEWNSFLAVHALKNKRLL